MWALSFMKSGHASHFIDRQMGDYQSVGSLTYTLWSEFVEDFITEFCPKNEIQTSRTELETLKYYQGTSMSTTFMSLLNKCDILKDFILS